MRTQIDASSIIAGMHTGAIGWIAGDARALADAHGYTVEAGYADERNAIEHTYVSGKLADYSQTAATFFGALKEFTSDEPLDSLRDYYNNEVGRRMAEWIDLNGYDISVLGDLVIDAIASGDLITGLNDPRIIAYPPERPSWRGPQNWHEPTITVPEPNILPNYKEMKDFFEDLKKSLSVPDDYFSRIIDDLSDLLRDILSDPIVLDLDGDGIELTSLASSDTFFDLDADGFAERTGWVGPHDGLLFHDADGDGAVDGVAELFGSATVDGYDELRPLDANGDNRIDAADPAFAALRIWRDLDGDGASTPDEVLTLAQAGIARLNLSYSQVDRDAAGNVIARLGSYVRTDGSSRAMGSVQFAMDDSRDWQGIPEGAALGNLDRLPNLPGLLALPDLRTAMYFDPALRAMVEDLVYGAHGFDTFAEFRDGGFAQVIYRWAGVDPDAPVPAGGVSHEVMAMAAFMGRPFSDVNAHQAERLAESWESLVRGLGLQFLFQAAQKPALDPFYAAVDALAALDPADSNYLTLLADIVEAADAQAKAYTPAHEYLELFTLLDYDASTGELSGDFDAFADALFEDQPSFGPSQAGVVPAWYFWFINQGSILFDVAAAMGIGKQYVWDLTGWDFWTGDVPERHGSDGDDLLQPQSTIGHRIFGYEGNDTIVGTAATDRIFGGPGDDLLKGGGGSDKYAYASGDGLDRIEESSGGDDTIHFSKELDPANLGVLRVAGTNDLLLHFGNPAQGIVIANQWTSAAAAIEHYHFVGKDMLGAGDIASLYLATLATAGADTISGSWAGERIAGLDGDDVLSGGDGEDELRGGAGNDSLNGGNHADQLFGGEGNDSIGGGAGADIIVGGFGNDTLQGGTEADSYIYNLGDGDDVINDYRTSDSGAADVLRFGEGITAEMLFFSRVTADYSDIRISFVGHEGSIRIDNQNWGDSGIEAVVFADGTAWNHAQLMARYVSDQQTSASDTIWGSNLADVVEAGDGDDRVVTGNGSDVIVGGAGADRLEAGEDRDTYVYRPGDGDDVIFDYSDPDSSGADTLMFGEGISPAMLLFSRVASDWSDIRISFAGLAGSVVIDNQNWGDAGIEAVLFSDGTAWTHAQLMANYVAGQQTDADDTVYGSNLADLVLSGAGNDRVVSGDGNDTIDGGAGNDRLEGGEGADTYHYARGSGDDVIYDYRGSRSNVLVFGEGIAASDLLVSRPADTASLRITFKSFGGSVVFEKQNWSDAGVELVRFADGTTLSEAQLGAMLIASTAGNDSFAGTAGDDSFWGLEGADTASGGGGADSLHGQDGSDVLQGGDGGDLLFGGAGDDTLYGDERVLLGPNLLVNGSFEQLGTVVSSPTWGKVVSSMPGWTKANSQNYEAVKSGTGSVAATHGSYWLDLDSAGGTGSNMDISQTVSGLAAGQQLRLQFDHANRTTAASGGLEVFWNGVLIASISETGTTMRGKAYDLVALAGDNVLRFRSIGTADNVGASLDNVRLSAVSAPTPGEDVLSGGDGSDVLEGGALADLLTGGGGSDVFRFLAGDSGPGAAADRIDDFAPGADRIDLSEIDADAGAAGDQAFVFIGSAAFSGAAGQLRFEALGADTLVQADVDGDAAADFELVLTGAHSLAAVDFLL